MKKVIAAAAVFCVIAAGVFAQEERNWLSAGIRIGAALSFYDPADRTMDQDVSAMPVLQVAFHPADFLAVQTEFMYVGGKYSNKVRISETVPYGNYYINMQYTMHQDIKFHQLQIPVLLKAQRHFGNFLVGALGGVYFSVPLDDAEMRSGINRIDATLGEEPVYVTAPDDENEKVKITVSPGYTVGGIAGYQIGPGDVFLDVRYCRDFGYMKYEYDETPYAGPRRDMFQISVGYTIGFLRK